MHNSNPQQKNGVYLTRGFHYLPLMHVSAIFSFGLCWHKFLTAKPASTYPHYKKGTIQSLLLLFSEKLTLYLQKYHPFLCFTIKFFRVLGLVLLWRTRSSCQAQERIVFLSILKSVLQGCGRHFTLMIQILSDHEQVNNAASSLLQLTHPVFSFWLGILNCIRVALSIAHQRWLQLAHQHSIWNTSSNRAVHYNMEAEC